MRVAIIGGGITGLTAAFNLSQKGHQVAVFERKNYLGGLSAGFGEKDWQWSLDYFYHHLFPSDEAAKDLIQEIGLEKKLFFVKPKTSIFKDGQVNQFDSALSVLKFPHLSLNEKLRTGLITAWLRSQNDWQRFEKITASGWLKKYYGQKVYQVLWQPLLEAKFGSHASRVSMSWFWARIKKRSQRLGYLEGGFQALIDRLAAKITVHHGQIFLNQRVENLNRFQGFDKIIVTTPLPEFWKIASLPSKSFGQLKFLHALNLVLILKEKFLLDGTYWLNVNQPDFPFVAVVEHTNFVNKKYYGGNYLVYVGGYYPLNHPFLKMKEQQIFDKFFPYLCQINPRLKPVKLKLFVGVNAQPVIPLGYSKIMPKMTTPIKNIYLANQSLIYPWDRGINYAIELGKRVALKV